MAKKALVKKTTGKEPTLKELRAMAKAAGLVGTSTANKQTLLTVYKAKGGFAAAAKQQAKAKKPAAATKPAKAKAKTPASSKSAKAAKTAEKPTATPAHGLKLQTGSVLKSKSGRELSPVPKVDGTSSRKAANSLKRIDAWLHAEALNEAESSPPAKQDPMLKALGEKGDTHAVALLKGINPKKFSNADRATVNLLLFGDQDGPTAAHLVSEPEGAKKLTKKLSKAKLPAEATKLKELTHKQLMTSMEAATALLNLCRENKPDEFIAKVAALRKTMPLLGQWIITENMFSRAMAPGLHGREAIMRWKSVPDAADALRSNFDNRREEIQANLRLPKA